MGILVCIVTGRNKHTLHVGVFLLQSVRCEQRYNTVLLRQKGSKQAHSINIELLVRRKYISHEEPTSENLVK